MRASSSLWMLLRAADEAHGRQAVAPAVERLVRGRDHAGMIGQAEVVVGAQVEHARARRRSAHVRALRRGDHALAACTSPAPRDLVELALRTVSLNARRTSA